MIDPQLLSEAGLEMLINKISNPVQQLKFQAGMYDNIQAGALLVADCRLIDQLRDAKVRAVQLGTYKRTGLLVLVIRDTLDSSDQRGGRGGGRGGYGYNGQVPAVVNSGIHYHKY